LVWLALKSSMTCLTTLSSLSLPALCVHSTSVVVPFDDDDPVPEDVEHAVVNAAAATAATTLAVARRLNRCADTEVPPADLKRL
jgi:hypothetical protein